MAKVHPSQMGRREIDRHFKWAPAQDPQDDDATPDSPWRYLKLDFFDPSDPDQRELLTGGPDTGHTCYRCGNDTYHVAAERDAAWVLQQPGVEIIGEQPDFEKLKENSIVIWGCPTCGDRVQWWKSRMPAFKEVK